MGFKKNNPGCNCCGGCELCADTMAGRADGTDITTGSPCGWTEVSGAWEMLSDELKCTSAGVALCNTAHSGGDDTMVAEVTFRNDTSGSTCNLIVDYVDSSNYWYAEYKVGDNTIKIYQVTSGTPTLITTVATGVTMNTSTDYVAKVCRESDGVHAGTISAYLDGVVKLTCYAPPLTGGTKAGLGMTGSGPAYFTLFTLSKSYASDATTCEACSETWVTPVGCATCCPGFTAFQLVLEVGATALANTVCGASPLQFCNGTECEDFGGDFTLTLRSGPETCFSANAGSPCRVWAYSSAMCTATECTFGGTITRNRKCLFVRLVRNATNCYWEAGIIIGDNYIDSGGTTFCHKATFQSNTSVDVHPCDGGPWTLTNIVESYVPGAWGSPCTGSQPATITLRIA